ncbi:MAG: ABC transporter ATP-binding protein [Firmicutes bacterium]|jgi:oligopeptide/dipeptide ABC transporter ATP-binding protein|nr:ABC transporter ATP-binding protein [Bacillota bacterium]
MGNCLLQIKDLKTYFYTDNGIAKAVDGVSFSVGHGQAVGLVGESGCGKSVTARSIMRLVDYPGSIVGGQVRFRGEDLLTKSEKEIRQFRGKEIAMIFQDPLTTLNPVLTVGDQIVEAIELHHGSGSLPAASPMGSPLERLNPFARRRLREKAWARALEMMEQVGIPAPKQRMAQYPHEFSGGMRQRVMIAIALSCNPALLIADEPTTALDVTVQAQILELMRELQRRLDMAVILITHDLGVVAEFCDRVVVMYAGKVVEAGPVEDILFRPRHPYTSGLLKSIPRIEDRHRPIQTIPGMVPELYNLPSGCRFRTRCPLAEAECAQEEPPLINVADDHQVSCLQAIA